MALLNFDARTVAPDPGVQEPLPAGWYNVVMVQSEMKPTADGTGQRLAIVFQVIDGQYANRKIFEGLNLVNSNSAAQEIAYKQLSAIGHAVGHVMIGDSTELHNKPLKVKVKIKPATGQYEAGNAISAYKNINEVVAAAGPANPFAPPPGVPAVAIPAGNAQWAPPAAPQAPAAPPQWAPPPAAAAPAAPPPQQWAPPPATAPAQPWAPPAAAPVAPQPQAPAAAAPQPVGMQPAWAQAPAPAAPAPAPAAPPQLQPPPGFAAPAAAAPAPAAQYAPPAGQPAPIQPPWATPAA